MDLSAINRNRNIKNIFNKFNHIVKQLQVSKMSFLKLTCLQTFKGK